MRSTLLDTFDHSINADQPLLAGLTNAGPVNMGQAMNIAHIAPSGATPYQSNPQQLQNFNVEDDDEWSDTDPMSFEDDQIFEHSPFLGIAIGKKAKARKVVRKQNRQAKRAAKRQAKSADIQSIAADSVWNQPNEVTPENYNPLNSESPLLQAVNANQPATNQLYNQVASQQVAPTGFETELQLNASVAQPAAKKNNTLLYVGIAAAVLVAFYFLKRK